MFPPNYHYLTQQQFQRLVTSVTNYGYFNPIGVIVDCGQRSARKKMSGRGNSSAVGFQNSGRLFENVETRIIITPVVLAGVTGGECIIPVIARDTSVGAP